MTRIFNLFPNDFSKIQAKDLLKQARQPIIEKGVRRKGIGPNTVYYYLDRLVKKGLVNKLPSDPNHPKDVYYSKFKNPKSLMITQEAINEVKSLIERLPEEFNKLFQRELGYYKEFAGEDFNEEEEEWAFKVITEDRDVIELKIASVLIKQAKRFIESTIPELKNKEYYVDSSVRIAPKSLVDERITPEEREKFEREFSNETRKEDESFFSY